MEKVLIKERPDLYSLTWRSCSINGQDKAEWKGGACQQRCLCETKQNKKRKQNKNEVNTKKRERV